MQSGSRGFSLLEVLGAIFVLSIMVLALAGVLIFNLKATAKPIERQTANLIAISALDKAEAGLRADWNFNPDFGPQPAPSDDRFTVTLTSTDANAFLKRLNVVVVWNDDNGAQTLELATAVERSP